MTDLMLYDIAVGQFLILPASADGLVLERRRESSNVRCSLDMHIYEQIGVSGAPARTLEGHNQKYGWLRGHGV